MPTNVVDSPRDEEKWQKAKSLAAEQGHSEEYDYIMGIYKKMKPSHKFKSADAGDVGKALTMVAIYPPKGWRDLLGPHVSAKQRDKLHTTLVFLGDTSPEDALRAMAVVRQVAAKHAPISMTCNGTGTFDNADATVRILIPNGIGLNELRTDLFRALDKKKLVVKQNHGYTPHMTLEYHEDHKLPAHHERVGQLPFGRWTVSEVRLVRGDKEIGRATLAQPKKEAQMMSYEHGYARLMKLAFDLPPEVEGMLPESMQAGPSDEERRTAAALGALFSPVPLAGGLAAGQAAGSGAGWGAGLGSTAGMIGGAALGGLGAIATGKPRNLKPFVTSGALAGGAVGGGLGGYFGG